MLSACLELAAQQTQPLCQQEAVSLATAAPELAPNASIRTTRRAFRALPSRARSSNIAGLAGPAQTHFACRAMAQQTQPLRQHEAESSAAPVVVAAAAGPADSVQNLCLPLLQLQLPLQDV